MGLFWLKGSGERAHQLSGRKSALLWCLPIPVLSKYSHHGQFQAMMVSQQAHNSSNDLAVGCHELGFMGSSSPQLEGPPPAEA